MRNRASSPERPSRHIAANLQNAAPRLDVVGGDDDNVNEMQALLKHMLMNKRDSHKELLMALFKREVEFCDAKPSALAGKQAQLGNAYELALARAEQQSCPAIRYAEISKLSCLHFMPEAELWLGRGKTSTAKATMGRATATRFYTDAESYYAKAYFHYRDLRKKFTDIAYNERVGQTRSGRTPSVESKDPALTDTVLLREAQQTPEVLMMQEKMAEVKPLVYQARINKHTNHIVLCLTKKMDPLQLLFSIVSLANVFKEYDPDTQKAYAGSREDLQYYLGGKISDHMKSLILSLDSPEQAQQMLRMIAQPSFSNMVGGAFWLMNHGDQFHFDDLVQQMVDKFELEIDEAIEADWHQPTNNKILRELKPIYERNPKACSVVDDIDDDVLPKEKLECLESAKRVMLEKRCHVLEKNFPVMLTAYSSHLFQFSTAFRDGVIQGCEALGARYKKTHPQLGQQTAALAARAGTDFPDSDADFERLSGDTMDAVYHVVRGFMTGDLWSPLQKESKANTDTNARTPAYSEDVLGPSSMAPNPTEIDLRDEEALQDGDMLAELSRTHRSSVCLSAAGG